MGSGIAELRCIHWGNDGGWKTRFINVASMGESTS